MKVLFRARLAQHPRADQNRKYLILSTEYEIESDAYTSATPSDPHCTVQFTALRDDRNYRPVRLTRKPVAQGVQTAVVVAPPNSSDQEIWMDEHGRVRVRFHWDRHADVSQGRVKAVYSGTARGSSASDPLAEVTVVDLDPREGVTFRQMEL